MASPYNANGKNGISVADAKAYIATIKTDAIANQIAHYKQVATSLNTLAQSVTTINSNLQETWSGIAADAANTKFAGVASHASGMANLLSEQVLPGLAAVQAGVLAAKAQIKGVQDEVTQVKNPIAGFAQAAAGIVGNLSIMPGVASQASTPPLVSNYTMTPAEAVAFNTRQRTTAAGAMNAVAAPYNNSATMFSNIASGLSRDVSDPTSPSTTAVGFTLTPLTGAAGSTGAASSYQSTIGAGDSGISDGSVGSSTSKTTIQDYVPPPSQNLPPPNPTSNVPPTSPSLIVSATNPVVALFPAQSDPVGDPSISTTPVSGKAVNGLPVETDPITGRPSGGTPGAGAGLGSSTPGLFGEGGVPDSSGSGKVSSEYSIGAPAKAERGGTGVIGGTPANSGADVSRFAEQPGGGVMGSGMRGVGGGFEGGGEVSGGPSAPYLRGRYLGDERGIGQPTVPWESPAVGGAEGALIRAQPAGGAGVTSVYAGARDSQGNPVIMMGGGGGFEGSRSFDAEKEEPGRRPAYLKEDPQWWSPEGAYVPPLVE